MDLSEGPGTSYIRSPNISTTNMALNDPTPTRHELKVGDEACDISTVCVYSDRAELTRKLQVNLPPGLHEIVVDGLPATIVSDTIRISGGKGSATILEVSFADRMVSDPPDANAGAPLLLREKELSRELREHEENANILVNSNKWLEEFSGKVCDQLTAQTHGTSLFSGGKEFIGGAREFITFKIEQGKVLADELRKLQYKQEQVQQELDDVRHALMERQFPAGRSVREVTIQIEVEREMKGGELLLTYVCYGARWSARYDARVDSNKKGMQLTYYGVVTNSTGEDWKSVQLSLSTAQPAVAGSPPKLPTSHVTRKAPPPMPITVGTADINSQAMRFSKMARKGSGQPMPQMMAAYAMPLPGAGAPPMMTDEVSTTDGVGGAALEVLGVAVASATRNQTSCTFSIPKAASIASNNEPHKVTITIVDMNPKFTYVAVPKLNTNAYLKATVVNDSHFPLIPGPMNVFMDSNYIATSELENVSPQEEFGLFLGTDGAVKINYAPPRSLQEQQGIMTKVNLVTFHRKTTIKNTKSDDVSVLIYDQLPLSQDARFKVTLREPEQKKKESFTPGLEWTFMPKEGPELAIKLNADHNLEVKTTVRAGQEVSIPLAFAIETPIDVEFELTDW